MSYIGERLRRKREDLGWSQSELARRMVVAGWSGYSQMAVSRTEANSRTPRLDEAAGLAQLLGVKIDWLATGDSEQQTPYDHGYSDGIEAARDALRGLIL